MTACDAATTLTVAAWPSLRLTDGRAVDMVTRQISHFVGQIVVQLLVKRFGTCKLSNSAASCCGTFYSAPLLERSIAINLSLCVSVCLSVSAGLTIVTSTHREGHVIKGH